MTYLQIDAFTDKEKSRDILITFRPRWNAKHQQSAGDFFVILNFDDA
jgi:hypothetical protein